MEATQLLDNTLDKSETYLSAEDDDDRNNCPKKFGINKKIFSKFNFELSFELIA